MNAIEIKNVSKKFKRFTLDNVSLSIPEGYIMGLVGANGAGKTTIIKLLMGLYLKDSGSISLLGQDPYTQYKIKDQVGFVFDNPQFYDFNLKKIKNIVKPFYSKWDDQVYCKYLERFKLSPKMRFKTLSRGMQLKFALTIALSHHARLFILDEPTSGLDPVFRNEFLSILQDLITDGDKTILFSSHITSDIEKIADYITYIKDGSIIFSEERESVFSKYLLIKDPEHAIPSEVRNIMIGGENTPYNYEALIPMNYSIKRSWSLEEKPTLDQIMFYHERGEKNVAFDSQRLKNI